MNNGLKGVNSNKTRTYKTGDVVILKSTDVRPVGWTKDGENISTTGNLYRKLQVAGNPIQTWVTQTSQFGTSQISGVAYGGGLWVAGGAGGALRISTDAVTWVTQTSTFGVTNINAVAYGNGLWVATGDTGTLRTSTDAVTWVTQGSRFGTSVIYAVAYDNGLWVAGGAGGTLRTNDTYYFFTEINIGLTLSDYLTAYIKP